MFEKVNPSHPDKVADRIAGALVDLSYKKQDDPKVAVEVLIGHGECHIINETSCPLQKEEVASIVYRIAGQDVCVDYAEVNQDEELAKNQENEIRCGDNGLAKGVPMTKEQKHMVKIANLIEQHYPSDGKYLLDEKANKLIICQSKAQEDDLKKLLHTYNYNLVINPLGYWTGGTNVDSGATNRKLGSDMGDSLTGGGLHGKDLSKCDITVNIYAWLKAQKENRVVEISYAIGDTTVDNRPYSELVEIAKQYLKKIGGFEKFAEHGLTRY